jgi:hypothetical protein
MIAVSPTSNVVPAPTAPPTSSELTLMAQPIQTATSA